MKSKTKTDLVCHIEETPLADTHEHTVKEHNWLHWKPDILLDLFSNYVPADLISAGANPKAAGELQNAENPDLRGRFEGAREAWEAARFTGYGEAVRILARELYGLEEITPESLEKAKGKAREYHQPGQRLHLMKDRANLDHAQVDDFLWACLPDESGPEFFLYDISWAGFACGRPDFKALAGETGVTVENISGLDEAMAKIFESHAACAIAVKSQHAYERTLRWEERSKADAESALQKTLTVKPEDVTVADRLCLGDWCLARGVELAIRHNLPFKLHAGYMAGQDYMMIDQTRSGQLCPLLKRYLEARFVLMHAAYPYEDELAALGKHFRNVYVDFCWAWAIDPRSSVRFARRLLHAVPCNKIFAFGGDSGRPTSTLAYAVQARRYLAQALQEEIDEGYLTERQAMNLAVRWMRDNQYACFDINGARQSIQKQLAVKG